MEFTPPYIYCGLYDHEELMRLPMQDAHVRAWRDREGFYVGRGGLNAVIYDGLTDTERERYHREGYLPLRFKGQYVRTKAASARINAAIDEANARVFDGVAPLIRPLFPSRR